MKSEVYSIKGNMRNKLLASILNVAAHVKRREVQLRRTTRDIRARVTKCVEVDGGILGTFIVNCNKFDISG